VNEPSIAQQVAEAIHADAQSGSAVWDELNGPDARFTKISDRRFTVTLPADYTDDGPDWSRTCTITITEEEN